MSGRNGRRPGAAGACTTFLVSMFPFPSEGTAAPEIVLQGPWPQESSAT